MAAIGHPNAFVTSGVTIGAADGTDYVNVSGASLSSGGFTVGNTYLVLVVAQVVGSSSAIIAHLRLVHGSTAFAETEQIASPNSSSIRIVYFTWAVWTAVSGEGITLQGKRTVGSIIIDQIGLVAFDITGRTYYTNERSTDDTITTSGVTGASASFTPANANDKWLVLTQSQIQLTSTTLSCGSRMVDVNTGSGTATPVQTAIEAGDTSEIFQCTHSFGCTLPASAQQFDEVSYAVTTNNGTRLHSKVLALRLNDFRNSVIAYTAAGTNLSATDFATELQTASLTPDVQGDVFTIGYATFDRQGSGREMMYRLQTDGSDTPGTQTSDAYFNYALRDSRDEFPCAMFFVQELTAAAHTFDLDASADATTNTPQAKDRSIVAFTMELPAAGGTFQKIVGSRFGLASAGGLAA